jgi:biopolymer transport protein ExbD
MRRHLGTARRAPASFEAINVTPLIDVVMCLIVFFLIVGKLAADATAVRLPASASGRAESAAKAVVVSIAPALGAGAAPPGVFQLGEVRARVWVDGQSVAGPEELETLIAQRARAVLSELGKDPASIAEAPLQIRGDRALPFAAVEPVLRSCAKLGIVGVRLATERAP